MNEDKVTNYTSEFLNSLNVPDFTHNLQLKVGSVVLMLWNLNQPKLCNDAFDDKKKTDINIIHAAILKGNFKDKGVHILMFPMIPTNMPFEFKLIQFPISVAICDDN